jgi:peptide/nickel transport system substrate-binding protein
MTWALHFSLAPTLFEPAETPGVVSPFLILYALHDALVKPMPGKAMAPSLAESWSVSPDGLVYEFVLRKGVRFHNGEPVTSEDAKFSFVSSSPRPGWTWFWRPSTGTGARPPA